MPRRPPLFEGVAAALVTLFDDTGAVDAPATARLAADLVGEGLGALVVAGTTGEAAMLAPDERLALLAAVRDAAQGSVPVLVGTGGLAPVDVPGFVRRAAAAGADGILALTGSGTFDHVGFYAAAAEAAGDVPVLAYHFPAVGGDLPVEVLARLAVAGCKDSSGDPERLLAALTAYDGPVYPGSSALLSFAGPLGCRAAILAVANLEPALATRALAGDPEAQLALYPAHVTAGRDFPRGLKAELHRRRGTSPVCRAGGAGRPASA